MRTTWKMFPKNLHYKSIVSLKQYSRNICREQKHPPKSPRKQRAAEALQRGASISLICYLLNGSARLMSLSNPGSLGFFGLPGWIILAGHFSAAFTSSLNVPALASLIYACLFSL